MRTPLASFRRLATALAPALALLALAAGLVSGLHHHALDHGHDQCAVCSHGATPAVATVSAAAPGAPALQAGSASVPTARAPRPHALTPSLSRAPPLA